MQVDYDFANKIHELADVLAGAAIRATYEKDIELHSAMWNSMLNSFDNIVEKCNSQMKKIGNI